MQFKAEMNKISAGIVGSHEGSDQVIAFNNNILAEVTNHYLEPGKALRPNELKKFQEDYKTWFLEKEVGKEFPFGEARQKEQAVDAEEIQTAIETDKQQAQEV